MSTSRDVSGVLLSLLIIHDFQYDNKQDEPKVSIQVYMAEGNGKSWYPHLFPVLEYIYLTKM